MSCQSKRINIFIEKPLHTVADRPEGYPWFAEFINRSEDRLIFRQFGYLRCRLLLYTQQELSELEAQLEYMDHRDRTKCDIALRSRHLDENRNKPQWRQELFEKVKIKLHEYSMMLSLCPAFLIVSYRCAGPLNTTISFNPKAEYRGVQRVGSQNTQRAAI